MKYGLIDDFAFFEWCESNAAALLAGMRARVHAIAHSVAAKARIVAADEHETNGIRALLNLGHTFGHALEAEAGFSDRLLHGEGVAAGCALAFRYSVRQGDLRTAGCRAGRRASPRRRPARWSRRRRDRCIVRDVGRAYEARQENGGGHPALPARAGIGQTYLDKTVDLADVAAFLDAEPR